jgi:hypothetical protein
MLVKGVKAVWRQSAPLLQHTLMVRKAIVCWYATSKLSRCVTFPANVRALLAYLILHIKAPSLIATSLAATVALGLVLCTAYIVVRAPCW